MTLPVKPLGWAFVPGPKQMDASHTRIDLDEITEYSPADISRLVLTYPDTRLINAADPSWYDWKAVWQRENRFLGFGMTTFDTEPEYWGGSPLKLHCTVADVITAWLFMLKRHSGIWLHNDSCDMHTPQSFLEEFAR